MRGLRATIRNDKPIIGIYNVNEEGSSDMYNKGGNMLHTIRQVIGNDEKWRNILRGLNQTFYHKTVESKEIEDYISQKAGIDLSKIFDQYLRTTQIPVLAYKVEKKKINYHWENCVAGFDMPIEVNIDGVHQLLAANTIWQSIKYKKVKQLKVEQDYYVDSRKTE
jgi:aminopeptidase N